MNLSNVKYLIESLSGFVNDIESELADRRIQEVRIKIMEDALLAIGWPDTFNRTPHAVARMAQDAMLNQVGIRR